MNGKKQKFKKGMIILWSGSVASIPGGWALCDGNNGTPNLTNKFLRCAGAFFNPGDTGGASSHTHGFTSAVHTHSLAGAPALSSGGDFGSGISDETVTGTTDTEPVVPPYYALAYIMKL